MGVTTDRVTGRNDVVTKKKINNRKTTSIILADERCNGGSAGRFLNRWVNRKQDSHHYGLLTAMDTN